MRSSPRQTRLREQRTNFLFFLGLAFAYLLAGYPVVAGSLSTQARHTAQSARPSFVDLDRNQDGYVDSSEAARYPAYAPLFSRADVSGDGRLTPAEFSAAARRLGRAP